VLPRQGRSGKKSIIWGVRTSWNAVGDGEFFCVDCGGDRNYRRITGHRHVTVLGVPLLPRGRTGPVVECAACRTRFSTEVLDRPTTTRFSAMLRDAIHTMTLAVLTVSGTSSQTATETAVATVRAAGFDECTQEQLTALVDALAADTSRFLTDAEPCGVALTIELYEALQLLAPHLVPVGRESILLQGARIALADGPYSPAERKVLATVGGALQLCTDDTTRLLAAAARMPS
jgi:hypothetical protein